MPEAASVVSSGSTARERRREVNVRSLSALANPVPNASSRPKHAKQRQQRLIAACHDNNPKDSTMTRHPRPATIAEALAAVEDGSLGYADANRKRVAASLRKCAAVYGLPLERLSADPVAFAQRWGRGPVRDFPTTHFRNAAAFADWRSNLRGALTRAAGPVDEPAPTDDAWAALLTATANRRARELGLGIALDRLAVIGRRLGLAPNELTTALVHRCRASEPIRHGKDAITRSVSRFDRLRDDATLAPFMPPKPLGPLPRLRTPRSTAWQQLPEPVRQDWRHQLATLAQGKPSPLTGRPGRPLSRGYMGQLEAAMDWYVEYLVATTALDHDTLKTIADLLGEDRIADCVRHGLADAEHGEGALSTSTVATYTKRLERLLQHVGREGHRLAALARDRALRQAPGLAPANEAFCRLMLNDAARRATLLEAPNRLRAKAEMLLAEPPSRSQLNKAIRAGTIAAAMALLIRVAPLRAENLTGLRFRGPEATLILGERGASLLIPGPETKNRKLFKAPFPEQTGARCPRRIIDWYLAKIRPLAVARGATDSDYLLPGRTGHLVYGAFLEWYRREMAALGLPMTPHQCRHAVATLLLDRQPDSVALVAALLGDDERTVLRHYAFIDRERRVERGQKALLDTARYHLRQPRR